MDFLYNDIKYKKSGNEYGYSITFIKASLDVLNKYIVMPWRWSLRMFLHLS